MASRRILLRATALGLAATAAGSLHAISKWTPPEPLPPFPSMNMRRMLLDSSRGLHAALLNTHQLSGAHLRDVRACAEHDLARVDAEGADGDTAAAADLRLLLALLATRDGRADDALQLYEDAARYSPFDPRPRALAYHLCLLAGRKDEAERWRAAYHRLVPEIHGLVRPAGFETPKTWELIRELAIAATVGGVCKLRYPGTGSVVTSVSCGTVDEGLVAALQDEALSAAERLQLRALRVYLNAKVRLLLRNEAPDFAERSGGGEPSPVSW